MITRTFESASSSAIHTARLDPATGESSCSCPAWRFKRGTQPRACKHTKALRDELSAQRALLDGAVDLGLVELPEVHAALVDAATEAAPKPMLASAMTKGTFADYCTPAYALEQKFDGHRVIIRKGPGTVLAWSRPRSGKAALIRTLQHALVDAIGYLPHGVYDGELVTAGGRSWDVARLETEKTLVLFDVLEIMGRSVVGESYTTRRELLTLALDHYLTVLDGPPLLAMPSSQPVCWEAVEAIWQRGGEGAILKRVAAPYQPGKRSADWLKVKKVGSAVLTVNGFEAGKNGPYSVLKLRGADGQETTVKTLTNALLAAIEAAPSSFIGRRVVISYCELTDTGSYRHGIFDHFAGEGE
jgi:hypothetical protein